MLAIRVSRKMDKGLYDLSWSFDTDFACYFVAAYSVYTKNANRWVIGGEFLHKKYDYKNMHIPVE